MLLIGTREISVYNEGIEIINNIKIFFEPRIILSEVIFIYSNSTSLGNHMYIVLKVI